MQLNVFLDQLHCFLTMFLNAIVWYLPGNDDHLHKALQVWLVFHHCIYMLDQKFQS